MTRLSPFANFVLGSALAFSAAASLLLPYLLFWTVDPFSIFIGTLFACAFSWVSGFCVSLATFPHRASSLDRR